MTPEWLIWELVTHHSGLKSFVEDPVMHWAAEMCGCHIPSAEQIRRDVFIFSRKLYCQILRRFRGNGTAALITDEWQDHGGRLYAFLLKPSYSDPPIFLCQQGVTTDSPDDQQASRLSVTLFQILTDLDRFNIHPQVLATDNTPVMATAVEDLNQTIMRLRAVGETSIQPIQRFPCVCHTLSLVVQDYLKAPREQESGKTGHSLLQMLARWTKNCIRNEIYLPTYTPTRWGTILTPLKCLLRHINQEPTMNLVAPGDVSFLTESIQLLEVLSKAIHELEKNTNSIIDATRAIPRIRQTISAIPYSLHKDTMLRAFDNRFGGDSTERNGLPLILSTACVLIWPANREDPELWSTFFRNGSSNLRLAANLFGLDISTADANNYCERQGMFSTTPEQVWTLKGGLWYAKDGDQPLTSPAPTSPEKEYELAMFYWSWMVHHGAPEAFCTLFRILSTATASEAVAERLFSKESMWYTKRRGRMTTKYASSVLFLGENRQAWLECTECMECKELTCEGGFVAFATPGRRRSGLGKSTVGTPRGTAQSGEARSSDADEGMEGENSGMEFLMEASLGSDDDWFCKH